MTDRPDEPEQWEVTLKAFCFESQETAEIFMNAITDAFCKLPEAEGIAAVTTFKRLETAE